jgi:hypothetical protein
MLPQLNWNVICSRQKQLSKDYKSKDPIVFTILFKNNQTLRKVIEFKDFLKFFWYIYDNNKISITDLIVSDSDGNELYKHVLTEKLPKDSSNHAVQHWNSLNDSQKETYLKILYAQLQYNK